MANITDAVKRAPKWAWVTVAGVGIGAGAIKLWRDRDAPEGDASTDPSTEIGAGYPSGPGSGGAGVIIPPVVYTPPSQDTGGLAILQETYIGAIGSIIDEWGEVYGPIAALLPQLVSTPQNVAAHIQALSQAGGAPTTPQQVVVSVQAPAPAAPAPPPSPAAPSCPAAYPHHNPGRGAVGPNSCYKNVGHCEKGNDGRWRRNRGNLYQNGTRVHEGNDYPGGCP